MFAVALSCVDSALVQYSKGKLCLGSKGGVAAGEHGALALISCQNTGLQSVFDDAVDPLGHPQIAAAGTSVCVNDDDVKCTPGNDMFFHACQGDDTNVHTANHFVYDKIAQQIVASFCSSSSMCLSATKQGGIQLGLCSDDGSKGWISHPATLPPTPPPSPWLPTPPPTPPTPPPTPPVAGKHPNIIFFLTGKPSSVLFI